MKYDIVIDGRGTTRYYKSNTKILHREDGPAVKRADGSRAWYLNNQLHRLDGPAVELSGDNNCYYINDIPFSKEQYVSIIKLLKIYPLDIAIKIFDILR